MLEFFRETHIAYLMGAAIGLTIALVVILWTTREPPRQTFVKDDGGNGLIILFTETEDGEKLEVPSGYTEIK